MGNDRHDRFVDDIAGAPRTEREWKGPGQKASGAPREERPDRLIDDRNERLDGVEPVDNDPPPPPVGGPAPDRDLDVDIIPIERGTELVDRGGVDGDDSTDDVTAARMSHKPAQRGDNGGAGGGGGRGDDDGGIREVAGPVADDIDIDVQVGAGRAPLGYETITLHPEAAVVDADSQGQDSDTDTPFDVVGAAPDLTPGYGDIEFDVKSEGRTETVDMDETIFAVDDWDGPPLDS